MESMYPATATIPEDMQRSREWTGSFFSAPESLPISFVLDDRYFTGIPADWQPVTRRRPIDALINETVFEGTDPATGLGIRVDCTGYRDFPVVEWVVRFANEGADATPVIRDILALDAEFKGTSPVLCHCNGDYCSEEGYASDMMPVNPGDNVNFAPDGGRSCNGAFPYYRLMFENCGITMAIGWPGQWSAGFEGTTDGIHVTAGQEETHLQLMPGERIRTPRMTILSWTGEVSRAVNLWRRWYLSHILPRPDGRPLRPLLACTGTDEGTEYTAATEENQIKYLDKFEKLGIVPDVWWLDAGWYPCYNENHERQWPLTGTWEPDPERFPRGLKPVSDHAAAMGVDLLLWFEPERVNPGTKLDTGHPDWLLEIPDEHNKLLNLGDPECRQWLTDHICALIKTNGIKIYRQDFNFDPLQYWRKNEAGNRRGITENLHVQGYLQFWDDLLARNPGLWIDSCSSGGRRNDLETMRRSVPLHYTDAAYGDHPVKLAFQRTLYEWIPYFKEWTLSWDIGGNSRFDNQVDSFSFYCGMAPMLYATLDIRRDDYDIALAKKMIEIWRRASELLLNGDYYQLTPPHRSTGEWVVRQFDHPESGLGLILAIRLQEAPDDTYTITPKGLLPNATYRFENAETSETKDISNAELVCDGFTFSLPKRSGLIWFYRRLPESGS